MQLIIKLQLGRIKKRITENHKIPFTYDDEVINVIANRCGEVESGARVVDAILTNTVLPKISQEFLTRMMQGEKIERVQVSIEDGDFRYGFE
jgi:type VI secretion system protein VasG